MSTFNTGHIRQLPAAGNNIGDCFLDDNLGGGIGGGGGVPPPDLTILPLAGPFASYTPVPIADLSSITISGGETFGDDESAPGQWANITFPANSSVPSVYGVNYQSFIWCDTLTIGDGVFNVNAGDAQSQNVGDGGAGGDGLSGGGGGAGAGHGSYPGGDGGSNGDGNDGDPGENHAGLGGIGFGTGFLHYSYGNGGAGSMGDSALSGAGGNGFGGGGGGGDSSDPSFGGGGGGGGGGLLVIVANNILSSIPHAYPVFRSDGGSGSDGGGDGGGGVIWIAARHYDGSMFCQVDNSGGDPGTASIFQINSNNSLTARTFSDVW